MFKHFLITRFNLKEAMRSYSPPSEEWMKSRFDLFFRFCLPSIVNQSNKNFIWLIYFDTDTPEKYKQLILQLERTHTFIRNIFIENGTFIVPSIKEEIKKLLETDTRYVITTRIDNDDALL